MSGSESGSAIEEVGGAPTSFTGPTGAYNTTPEVVDPSQAGPSNCTRRNFHMGSLRRNEMVTDDLEAQHRSQWLSKLKNTLRAHEEKEENKIWDFCIMKVPESRRQPAEEFTPATWRFGLHNRENLDTNGSEALKISFAEAFGLVGDELDKFCNAVVDDPKSMLQCYGLEEEATSWSDEVIKYVLALDALFLALLFDLRIPECHLWTSERWASITQDIVSDSRYKAWILSGSCLADICKYENQIPFVLIQRAYVYLSESTLHSVGQDHVTSAEIDAESYRCWEKEWMASAVQSGIDNFMDLDFDCVKSDYPYPLINSKHILGLAYEAICGLDLHATDLDLRRTSDDSQKDYIHIPSATQLKASGIKIKGLPQGPLFTMSYKSECLFLPRMNIFDSTTSFIRNMARYEDLLGRCVFHDYILIMLDLIKTPMDLEILIKRGVVFNGCGVRAFNTWMGVDQYQVEMPSSRVHNEMKVAINMRCKLSRYRHWSEFMRLFCSRPWLVLSAVTIVLVTVATLLQAYAAIIGSNKMKPQFP